MIQAAMLSLLSALGILLLLWCLLGWIFFPAAGDGYCVLFFHKMSRSRLNGHLLLRHWGLQRLPLILVCMEQDSELYQALAEHIMYENSVILLTQQEWHTFREMERDNGVSGS